ncbi:hypothetical protein AB0C12_33040 [Actinoplanes sp. NPDC048967]|uniref:hypothetical protein n=1 Tax=Actinoplanes sp. NPDC048967 TaxID=3155269 RepID=UPI0033C4F9BF
MTVIMLAGPPPAPVCAIIARITGDASANAVLRAAAEPASAYGVELVVDAGLRQCRGGPARAAPPWCGCAAEPAVVAGDGSDGAHVVVRPGADQVEETPAQGVPRLRSPAGIGSDGEATQVTRA